MVGQKYLQNLLKDFTIDTFPRSLILIGEKGCGRRTYCALIKERLENTSKIPIQLNLIDITNNISLDFIEEIHKRVEPSMYIIDSSQISIREQNIILKLLEEPMQNTFIIIICEDEVQLLPTVLNRCQRWYFEDYTDDELSNFSQDPNFLEVLHTPGKLLEFKGTSLTEYKNLIQKIFDKMCVASLPNALSITDKIAFKNEKDKLNLELFQNVLANECMAYIHKTQDMTYWDEISQYLIKSQIPKVDQKILFDNFIVNLWESAHNGDKRA